MITAAVVFWTNPNQGKTSHLTYLSLAFNYYLLDTNTAFGSYKFIYCACLDAIQLLVCYRFQEHQDPKQHQKCKYPLETLPHVLNQCNVHKTTVRKRHNARAKPIMKGQEVRVFELTKD